MNVGSRWQQILDWPGFPFLLHDFRPFQDSCVRPGQKFDAGQRLRNGASERISITRRGYSFCFRTEPHEGLSFVSSRLVNIQQWHFEQFAVAEHVTVNRNVARFPVPRGFPSNFLWPGWNASILADLPVFHATVFVIVVLLREAA